VPVIPGRVFANPESITPVFAFSIQRLAQEVWIPGSHHRAAPCADPLARPGMTMRKTDGALPSDTLFPRAKCATPVCCHRPSIGIVLHLSP
jgi:hypothetical protein